MGGAGLQKQSRYNRTNRTGGAGPGLVLPLIMSVTELARAIAGTKPFRLNLPFLGKILGRRPPDQPDLFLRPCWIKRKLVSGDFLGSLLKTGSL